MSFESDIVKLKMDEMFNGRGHFSICDIDDIGKIIGANPQSHKDYKLLKALHCVHYSDMSNDILAELKERCMAVMSAKFDTGLMSKALIAVMNGEVKDQPQIEDTYIDSRANIKRIK